MISDLAIPVAPGVEAARQAVGRGADEGGHEAPGKAVVVRGALGATAHFVGHAVGRHGHDGGGQRDLGAGGRREGGCVGEERGVAEGREGGNWVLALNDGADGG